MIRNGIYVVVVDFREHSLGQKCVPNRILVLSRLPRTADEHDCFLETVGFESARFVRTPQQRRKNDLIPMASDRESLFEPLSHLTEGNFLLIPSDLFMVVGEILAIELAKAAGLREIFTVARCRVNRSG
jgi:hypothetical protein